MLSHRIGQHHLFGRCLFADNGIIEIIIPLEYGLRIAHFSFCGKENVFYEHPADSTIFTTNEGWRIRGGHRMWLAPESLKVYFPDNAPIDYSIENDTILITQPKDPWLNVIKSIQIRLDDARLELLHKVKNVGESPLTCSIWAISVMAPGGKETISFERRDGGMDPWHHISMWDYTNLGDPRARYTRDSIEICHLPIEEKYKIGVGHPYGPIRYENKNTVFLKRYPIQLGECYPDGNVSFETYFSKQMAEIESLSPLRTLSPKEEMEHQEVLDLLHKE